MPHHPVPRADTPSSVLPQEVARFDALAATWWDPRGPMRVLHAMNPARIGWTITQLRGLGLAGGTLLDVGCGAGLAAEALARAGHPVTGIDAASASVQAARAHAPPGLPVTYRQDTAEALRAEGARFHAVTALEVIEHVADPAAFMATLAGLLHPGGALVVSTLNRTAAAFVVAKLGAEYVARLLPPGTHDPARFVTPAELAAAGRAAALRLHAIAGLRYAPGRGWRAGSDVSINYIACFAAPRGLTGI